MECLIVFECFWYFSSSFLVLQFLPFCLKSSAKDVNSLQFSNFWLGTLTVMVTTFGISVVFPLSQGFTSRTSWSGPWNCESCLHGDWRCWLRISWQREENKHPKTKSSCRWRRPDNEMKMTKRYVQLIIVKISKWCWWRFWRSMCQYHFFPKGYSKINDKSMKL